MQKLFSLLSLFLLLILKTRQIHAMNIMTVPLITFSDHSSLSSPFDGIYMAFRLKNNSFIGGIFNSIDYSIVRHRERVKLQKLSPCQRI